ncbi:hypothetical protein AWM68_17950 [Fictibacillus phosphorivorans]|uniref:Uncharacterized protein n=1 Tax=Fictibacillus phosphorivorans TaxID=1221500 RepID=A0A163RVH7_9BACL|nr:hypothetical protein [Fictibacillus phosphorivorans]KZE67657.1 hypothetical protein AWM68_17950 [Fictibacillus phosphorivorans]
MEDRISTLLTYAGWILISIGIIGGIITYSNVDKESYKTAKEVFDELYDNEFAEASYITAKQIYLSEISNVISITIGGIVSGLVLIGLGRIIWILNKRKENDEKIITLLRENQNLRSLDA